MIDQEVYDLTQTGQQVQNILYKGEALPSNPELQEALDSKADKGNTYTKDQVDAKVNQGITAAEAAAESAAQNAENAAESAEAAAQRLADLEVAIQQLPDGQAVSAQVATNTVDIANLKNVVADLETIAEGYVRVAGSSNPALNYRSYKYNEQGSFGRESVFHLFYPCLVGTKLTGNDAQVGKVLHILQKLDWNHDLDGNARLIDGSEGDVMIVNIEPYYQIFGKHTIDGTEYDVFLVSRTPFTWQGIDAEPVEKFGWAPDYCVNHTDTDTVQRMHSAYNPAWDGSYQAPDSIVGKFVYTQDAETGVIGETYDADATLLGGAGGLHTTNMTLYDGEQKAMNQNPDTTKTVPFMNATAHGSELMMSLLLAEGGTFDAHNASLMGSGFCSNDGATAAGDWEEGGTGAKNGMRLVDKNGAFKYYGLNSNIQSFTGKSGAFYAGSMINSWRNPWHIMELQSR